MLWSTTVLLPCHAMSQATSILRKQVVPLAWHDHGSKLHPLACISWCSEHLTISAKLLSIQYFFEVDVLAVLQESS